MNRIERLIGSMTLAEKLGQLTMTACSYAVTGPVVAGDSTESIRSGAIGNLLNLVGVQHIRAMQRLAVEESRLRIPLLIGLDVVHGYRVLFPIPLGEAATFDPEAWKRSAQEAAREAAADGLAMTFAPMVDVSRDPRWGRSAEGPGEDPWLAMRFAEAKVRGFQGDDLSRRDVLAAVAKHYVAYGPVTAGREYASVDISARTLHEVHLPAFAAAVSAGVAAIMPAFTDLAGVPMTAHKELLRGWLRETLGFAGVIVSDYNAIAELRNHGIAADLAEAAAHALQAGVDIDMMSDAYRHGLPIALGRGLVALADIDASVRRVLTLKERLGLFDDPYGRGRVPEPSSSLAPRQRLARDIAARSLVLLKNEHDTLPLADTLPRLAIVGPLADASTEMRGPWWGAADSAGNVTVLEGVRSALTGTQILHAAGVSIEQDDTSGIAEAAALCDVADAVLLCLGEAAVMSGEAASRAHLGLPGRQAALAQAVLARAKQRHVPVTIILFSGRPLIIPDLMEAADAVLAVWFPGTQAGHAIADVLVGKVPPCGRTPMSWPRSIGQIPVFFGGRPTGRPANPDDHFTSKYLDEANEPLFPFGFGLSYGRFALANLRVTTGAVRQRDDIVVRVDVTNEGARAGEETVFLFAHDVLASVSRPLLELKGFAKIRLAPGEQGTVQITLPAHELRFLGLDLQPVFEAGEVEILVGPCADRRRLLSAKVLLAL